MSREFGKRKKQEEEAEKIKIRVTGMMRRLIQ
jgi:hypothetical protein